MAGALDTGAEVIGIPIDIDMEYPYMIFSNMLPIFPFLVFLLSAPPLVSMPPFVFFPLLPGLDMPLSFLVVLLVLPPLGELPLPL